VYGHCHQIRWLSLKATFLETFDMSCRLTSLIFFKNIHLDLQIIKNLSSLFKKFKNTFICNLQKSAKLVQEMSLLLSIGGSIKVGPSLGENYHKSSLIAGESSLLNEGVVPLLWITSYTTLLNG
jgi:hypothetical protein